MKSSYLPAHSRFTEHIHVAATADGHDPGAARDLHHADNSSVDIDTAGAD
jgi:hypothetical protein